MCLTQKHFIFTGNVIRNAEKEFTPDFQSVIDIIENDVINEHRCIAIDYLVQFYGYDKTDRNKRRYLKTKLIFCLQIKPIIV